MSVKTYLSMTKPQLVALINYLDGKLAAYQDRGTVEFFGDEYVPVPIPSEVKDWVTEHFNNKLRFDDYNRVGDERHYEEFHECELLPGFLVYLVKYSTDLDGNQIDTPRVWGLRKISEKEVAN